VKTINSADIKNLAIRAPDLLSKSRVTIPFQSNHTQDGDGVQGLDKVLDVGGLFLGEGGGPGVDLRALVVARSAL